MEKDLFDDLKAVLRRYRRQFIKGFLTVLISNFFLILNPLIFREAVFAIDASEAKSDFFFLNFFKIS